MPRIFYFPQRECKQTRDFPLKRLLAVLVVINSLIVNTVKKNIIIDGRIYETSRDVLFMQHEDTVKDHLLRIKNEIS